MKKNVGPLLALYPMPVAVLGAMNGKKPTWTLVAHMGIIGHDRILVSLAAPRIIQTFLESYSFENKAVYTFSTSGSSSGSGAYDGLRGAYSAVRFAGNLHFTSSQLSSAQPRVSDWLAEIGM